MNRRSGIPAAALLLLLTGCSATQIQQSDMPARDTQPTEQSAITAPERPANDSESVYLEVVRENLKTGTVIFNATNDQLLEAGAEACEKLAARTDDQPISVIEGEKVDEYGYYIASGYIVQAAAETLC